MKLSDLNPQLHESGTVEFDCPAGHPHRVFARIAPGEWTAEGTFPDSLSLLPSILAETGRPNDESLSDGEHKQEYDNASKCGWHGYITNGEVTTC